ncbi:MAG: energy transducer TonB [Chitinophagaceae bacterium]|nr:energy transducer TonB [Chitinophagaceae bacterium]
MTLNFWLITFFFMMTLHTVQGQSGNHIPDSRQEQTMPEFPGGEYLLSDFISKELKYPADARSNKTDGRVLVRFVVDENGKISVQNIVSSGQPSLDSEAVRVVRQMPDWTPGTVNGKKVKVMYTLPITFELQNNDTLPIYKSILTAIKKREFAKAEKKITALQKDHANDIDLLKLQAFILLEKKKMAAFCELIQQIYFIGDQTKFTDFTSKEEINFYYTEHCSKL